MMDKNLFLSFGDTIVKRRDLVAQYMNKKYEIETEEKDWKNNNNFNDVINSFRKDRYVDFGRAYKDFWDEFSNSFDLESFQFFENAIETIIKLSSHYRLYIVDASPKTEKRNIEKLLKKAGILNCFSGIFCTLGYEEDKGEFVFFPKGQFIENVKTGVNVCAIDDSKKDLETMKKAVLAPILFDPKEKQNIFDTAKDWLDISNMFCVEKKYWLPTH